MNIDIRIFGVPERMERIRELQRQLNIPDGKVVIDNNHEGVIATAKKVWLLPTDKSHVMVLQDDVELCDGFTEICEKIVKTHPDVIFSALSCDFYNQSVFNRYGMPKNSPYICVDNITAQCIIMPNRYIKPCINAWKDEIRGDDTNISYWANHNNIKMFISIPAIVQHVGVNSVFSPGKTWELSDVYCKTPSANWETKYYNNFTNFIRR